MNNRMKLTRFGQLLWAACLALTLGAAQADPVGFASLNGGTTGGADGRTITVTNGADLQQALKDQQDADSPLTIYVDGRITPENSGVSKIDIKDLRDVSIIGVEGGAEFDGIGIKLNRAHNVIVRNLIIHHVDTGDKDAIGMEGGSTNVWIDHNTLYASLDVDKDYYDGLLDTKRGSKYITISYNYFHDSWKASLHGSSDDDSGERKITFHHNRWEDINSRTPLFRFGEGHVFNNYYYNLRSTGINSRMGAQLRIENNHFDNAADPIVAFYSDEIGYWDVRGNMYDSVSWDTDTDSGVVAGPNPQSTTTYNPPYDYPLDDVSCVRSIVMETAGAGKGLATSNGSCAVEPGPETDPVPPGGGSDDSGGNPGNDGGGDNDDGAGDDDGTANPPTNPDENLSIGAGSDGSSKADGTSYGNVRDGDTTSYWQPESNTGERISVKWDEAKTFNTLVIREPSNSVSNWRVVNHETGAQLASGTGLGDEAVIELDDVTMEKVNLMVDGASGTVRITEFEVYYRTDGGGSDDSPNNGDTGDNDTDNGSGDDADEDTGDSTDGNSGGNGDTGGDQPGNGDANTPIQSGTIPDGRYRIVSTFSDKALTVDEGSTADGANVVQWDYTNQEHQQWNVTDLGDGYYAIRAAHSGKALDVYGWSTADGGEIRQWAWLDGVNQHWMIENIGNGEYRIISRHSGKSLDVFNFNRNNGGDIRQWNYWGGQPQRWAFYPVQ